MVLEGRVCERESRWNLARLAFAGGSLWARDLFRVRVGESVLIARLTTRAAHELEITLGLQVKSVALVE